MARGVGLGGGGRRTECGAGAVLSLWRAEASALGRPVAARVAGGDRPGVRGASAPQKLPRKEVIQPQLPLRLPCYDFVPVASPTFGGCLRSWRTDFKCYSLP